MNKVRITSILVLAVLTSCSKVGRDEFRIKGDHWKVSKFIVNNIDSTAFVKYPSVLGYRFELDDNDKKYSRFHDIYEIGSDGTETHFGHWGRRDNNKMFLGVEYKVDSTGPFYPNHYSHYFDIVQVKKDVMEYKLQLDGSTYEIQFGR